MSLCVIIGSCDDPDGKWDDMKWKSQTHFTRDFPHEVTLKASGETVSFTCLNYAMMGIDAIDANGYRVPCEELDTCWWDLTWNDDVFIMSIPANHSGKTRVVQIYPWSGDVQDSFLFRQPAMK